MKGKIRKKTGRILGGVFLFALVIGMLVVPYMTDGEGKVAKAGRTFESYFNEAPVPKTELVYNGEDQELMNPGNGAGGNGIVRVLWSVYDKHHFTTFLKKRYRMSHFHCIINLPKKL